MAGGARSQVNKSHKTRFASKSSRNVHKIPLNEKSKISKSDRNAGNMGRAARLQCNKMLREHKRAALLKEKRASSGSTSPPLVLFGLSESVNLSALEKEIISLLSGEENGVAFPAVASAEYRLRTTVLKAPHGDLTACMEMAKVADLIAFVASASCISDSDHPYMDLFGSQCLSVFRALGLPSTVVLLRDLPDGLRRKQDIKKACISTLTSEFPEDCKFHTADSRDELHKFMWLLREQRLTVPDWRKKRSYLMSQKVTVVAEDSSPGKCSLLLTGYTRARNLSVNQLVHVAGGGDYQLSKIELLKDPCPLSIRKGDSMDLDDLYNEQVIRCLMPDPMKQESLVVENTPDPLAGEQTWPTESEMAEANRSLQEKKLKKRNLPPGTSDYQDAWILDNSNGDGDDGMVRDENQNDFVGQVGRDEFELDDDEGSFMLNKWDGETEMDSVMQEGENLTNEQIEEEIKKIKDAHAEDEEYPDEVDTPKDVTAKERFAKYRGLKSFRTSSWDPKESLPSDYARIFAFDNISRTQKHVMAEALELHAGHSDECVTPGSYVRLYVKDVPADVASRLSNLSKTMPIVSCGLLQHESKISVLHFKVKKHDMYKDSIKSKEELLFHVGFRQFMTRPIFSSDSMNTDKHKMERNLHAGRYTIASIYAPICFPTLPLIVLKTGEDVASPTVAALGSLRSIDPDRIILKKVTLKGSHQPLSRDKSSVSMFHSPEDVRYFKPVEVRTTNGRHGRITKPVGTHGKMKCKFSGIVQPHNDVCMDLYKRSYPKWPQHWFPLGA